MNPTDAEEYTQALGQVVAGGWRQIALGHRLGVPQALNMTVEEWVQQRLGGYVRLSLDERKLAAVELKTNGLSQRQIGAVLGVDQSTIHADLTSDGNPSRRRPSLPGNVQNGDGNPSPTAPLIATPTRTKEFYTLEDWQKLTATARRAALTFRGQDTFNKQGGEEERDTQKIEWAQWSWNPVTGCRHNCPYCYARDIAHRFTTAFPMGFEPALRYGRLTAPKNTSVPASAATDPSFRNVFTCSMADLFGRWVPTEWIQAVLDQVAANPQWNFLFLTKFAARLTEFTFPPNAWIGTTVDCQARVKAAEDAFARVQASVKWLSVEPMIEPLTFQHLDRFDWIVIGGASPSMQTPEWRVPVEWWVPLYREAKRHGLAVYLKSNLYERERGYPGMAWEAPQIPASFVYLKTKTKDEIVLGEK